MQPARMPLPESRYLRPTTSPAAHNSQRQFAEICGSGDIKKVAEIVESDHHDQEYLTRGLCAAIYNHDLRIVEYLLKKVTSTRPDVLNAAASVRSLPIFQLLIDHRWDINMPILGDMTSLM